MDLARLAHLLFYVFLSSSPDSQWALLYVGEGASMFPIVACQALIREIRCRKRT